MIKAFSGNDVPEAINSSIISSKIYVLEPIGVTCHALLVPVLKLHFKLPEVNT